MPSDISWKFHQMVVNIFWNISKRATLLAWQGQLFCNASEKKNEKAKKQLTILETVRDSRPN